MKKWRVGWTTEIEEFEVVRETEHNVWLQNQWGTHRHLKKSKDGIFYDTFEAARDHVHGALIGRVAYARAQLKHANEELREFEVKHAIRSEASVQAVPVRKHSDAN